MHGHPCEILLMISFVPEPKENPYLRKFLLNDALVGNLPDLVVEHFIAGITWAKPLGLGRICSLIINLMQWCSTDLGDDGNACVSKALRAQLADKMGMLVEGLAAKGKTMSRESRPDLDTIEVNRLHGMLKPVEHLQGPPGVKGYYLKSTKDFLLGQIPGQEECDVCMEEDATNHCSRCKSVRYCSTKCQKVGWKEHQMRCFTVAF